MAPEIKDILDLDFTAQEPEPGTENFLYTTFGKIQRPEDRMYFGNLQTVTRYFLPRNYTRFDRDPRWRYLPCSCDT